MQINSYNYFSYTNRYNRIGFRSKDLLELPKEDVLKKVRESVTPENFLGRGLEANVYRIKNTDYCIRIPLVSQDFYDTDYSKELNSIDRVNHKKIKLGFGAAILDFFEGVTPKKYKSNAEKRYKLQSQIANMPVKSYSEFLHQIANAIDNEMEFDCAGGNIIVNPFKKKLTAIDFYGISSDNPRPITPLSEMHSVLTMYGSKPETSKQIGKKVLMTGLEEFKPNNIPCMDIALFDFEELLENLKDDNIIGENSALKKALEELKEIKKKEITDKTLSTLLKLKFNKIAEMIKVIA